MVRRAWEKPTPLPVHRHSAASSSTGSAFRWRCPAGSGVPGRMAGGCRDAGSGSPGRPWLGRVSSVTRDAHASLVRIASEIIALGAPSTCAGCGAPGAAVCEACEAWLGGPPWLHAPTPTPSPWPTLHVTADYGGSTRALITAWKERGRRDVAPALARALTRAVIAALPSTGLEGEQVAVVPIPASDAARRRRGEDAWARVAGHAVARLAEEGVPASLCMALSLTRQPRDQSALAAAQRHANLDGALVCRRVPAGIVVVVDDIVTTGATVAEAARALRDAGCDHARAAAIAATSRTRRGTARRQSRP